MASVRLWRRAWQHHLPLATGTLAGLLMVLFALRGERPVYAWSMATAYVALALLGATLLAGPVRLLRGRPVPVSFDLRRDIGIWAGLVSLAHVGVGMWVHMPQRFMYWLVRDDATGRFALRTDAFGLTNHAGTVAAFCILLLLATSSDAALRTLGRSRWKAVQRVNYALFLLVLAHGVVYQLLEKRVAAFVVVSLLLVVPVLAGQGAGVARHRRHGGA